jgi:pimeloyl-ACP methyl ester carboxylesterase
VPVQAGKDEDAILNFPYWMLDDGMRRYWISRTQLKEPPNEDVLLNQFERFDIKPKRQGGAMVVESVGPFKSVSPFNNVGHREVTVAGANQKTISLIQGLTQLRPQSCTVTGLNHEWEFSIATSSLSKEELTGVLQRWTTSEKTEERFAVVRFLQQAGMYESALEECERLANDRPELKPDCEQFAREARQLLARRLLQELKHRRAAGQHRLVLSALNSFPTQELGADILREMRLFHTEFTDAQDKIDRVKQLLGELQSGLSKDELAQVAPLRDEVIQQIDFETLPRLEPFLKLEKDATLTAAQKLALAYSGWVLGDANATTDFPNAFRLWQARFYILQYQRASHPQQRQQALADLTATEGVGPKTIEQLIPHLPPTVETTALEPGKILKLSLNEPGRTRDEEDNNPTTFKYSVLVPQEFNPHHKYPLIIAMHEGGSSPERVLKWWGGDDGSPLQSQRHGYIVIAPEYLPPKPGDPLPAPTEVVVWECLRDVRRRFAIDSGRIYLSGHGRGAEAAFDVSLAHPDLFAGVLPISGGVERGSKKLLRQNARDQAWYVVMGEFDFGLFNRNAKQLEDLLRDSTDLVISQYKSRGHETFYSEIHRLFDWMELHRRPPEPSKFEFHSFRTHDVRLHWVRWSNTSLNNMRSSQPIPVSVAAPKSPDPIKLTAKILPGSVDNKRTILLGGHGPITLWLNPTLFDFDKRLVVEVGGKRKFNDFLKPEVEAVLEDYRQRGDRQRLHSVRVQID